MSFSIVAAFGLRWVARLSRNEEDQKTIRGIVFPTNDVSLVQGRDKLGLDVEVEEFVVHRAVDHPGRVQPVMAQGGDEGLRLPVAEGGVVHQARATGCPSGRLGHVRLERRFVDKSQSWQNVTHERLAATGPDLTGQCNFRPLLLDGAQIFFCVSDRARAGSAGPRRGGPRPQALAAVRPPVHQGSGRAFP